MKVLDLACPNGHVFEGWFGSEHDYQSQLECQLIECPLCGSHEVIKRLSAPRLNLKTSSAGQLSQKHLDGERKAHAPSCVGAAHPSETSALAAESGQVRQASDARQPQQKQGAPEFHAKLAQLQTAWLAVARQVMRETHDVGEQFASDSRRMHYGEIEPRAIRGVASPQEAQELREEGIDVMVLPLLQIAKETLQ